MKLIARHQALCRRAGTLIKTTCDRLMSSFYTPWRFVPRDLGVIRFPKWKDTLRSKPLGSVNIVIVTKIVPPNELLHVDLIFGWTLVLNVILASNGCKCSHKIDCISQAFIFYALKKRKFVFMSYLRMRAAHFGTSKNRSRSFFLKFPLLSPQILDGPTVALLLTSSKGRRFRCTQTDRHLHLCDGHTPSSWKCTLRLREYNMSRQSEA
jgi:hypothetical protein